MTVFTREPFDRFVDLLPQIDNLRSVSQIVYPYSWLAYLPMQGLQRLLLALQLLLGILNPCSNDLLRLAQINGEV